MGMQRRPATTGCWFCQAMRPWSPRVLYRVACQSHGWGRSVPVLVQEPAPPPVWGVDTGRCGATPCAEFGGGAAMRKGIPRRIGESRSFVSLQSELGPNENRPCWEGQMGESGLSTSTGRRVRLGVGRVPGCRCMRPVGRESRPMPTRWNPSLTKL